MDLMKQDLTKLKLNEIKELILILKDYDRISNNQYCTDDKLFEIRHKEAVNKRVFF